MKTDISQTLESVPISCFCYWFSNAIKNLLEFKHLYQNINIQAFYEQNAKNPQKYDWSDFARMVVDFGKGATSDLNISLPQTINVVCANRHCSTDVNPHNFSLCLLEELGFKQGYGYSVRTHTVNDGYRAYYNLGGCEFAVQQFTLQYQCQKCKGEPLTFMIRREGLKLQLVGRSSIEPCVLPEGFPKEEEYLFSDAICARQTGSTLAAICLLRIAIEQYVRRLTNNQDGHDLDAIFDAYKAKLPADFPLSHVGLLRVAYDKLSACIHAAQKDESCFDECMMELKKHFKMIAAFA